jgi:tRNA(Ile)-lysidine synthase
LIGNWMRARGIGILATGHTSDDQAETVLMRLARGSGLEGLSGMKPHRPFPTGLHPELTIARPLLSLSHDRLIATLRMRNLPWIEDPSNGDARFLRVQVRRMMPQLAQLGMSPSRLAETAAHLSRANNLVSGLADALEARCVGMQPWGYALLRAEPLRAAHDEVACRVLAQTLKTVSGATYPPVFGHVEAALRWIREAEGVAGRTLGGCRLARRADGAILVAREDAAIERGNPVERIRAGQTVLWDGRFSVTMPDSVGPGEFEVKAVGMRGLLDIPGEAGFPPHEPRRVAAACPGIWQADRLVSAPNLGFHRDFCGTSTFRGLTRV